jgi:glycyl-tRNA synthetase beta chain
MIERLDFYLRDVLGTAYDVVNATLAADSDDVLDAITRARAITEARGSADFTSISAAFKRMKNILRQAAEKKIEWEGHGFSRAVGAQGGAAASAAEVEAENELIAAFERVSVRFREYKETRNYAAAVREMASLRAPVDAFFDHVMVMAEDPGVRARRLALLQAIVNEFSSVADFSEIVTESK